MAAGCPAALPRRSRARGERFRSQGGQRGCDGTVSDHARRAQGLQHPSRDELSASRSLLDPILNTRIAVEHLHRILGYPLDHPGASTGGLVRSALGGASDARLERGAERRGEGGPGDGTGRRATRADHRRYRPHRCAGDGKPGTSQGREARPLRRGRAPPGFLGDPEPVPSVPGGGAGTAVAFLAPIGALALGNSVLQSGRPSKRGEES